MVEQHIKIFSDYGNSTEVAEEMMNKYIKRVAKRDWRVKHIKVCGAGAGGSSASSKVFRYILIFEKQTSTTP